MVFKRSHCLVLILYLSGCASDTPNSETPLNQNQFGLKVCDTDFQSHSITLTLTSKIDGSTVSAKNFKLTSPEGVDFGVWSTATERSQDLPAACGAAPETSQIRIIPHEMGLLPNTSYALTWKSNTIRALNSKSLFLQPEDMNFITPVAGEVEDSLELDSLLLGRVLSHLKQSQATLYELTKNYRVVKDRVPLRFHFSQPVASNYQVALIKRSAEESLQKLRSEIEITKQSDADWNAFLEAQTQIQVEALLSDDQRTIQIQPQDNFPLATLSNQTVVVFILRGVRSMSSNTLVKDHVIYGGFIRG